MSMKENNKKSVILNLTADLRRLSLQLVNNLRGRFQIKFGMTPCVKGFTLNRHAESSLLSISTATKAQSRDPEQKPFGMALCKGFTLIELLIVVLIIGILAAVAVPQYQKAVLKSRFSSLMPTTQAIRDGNEMYYMTNGGYADAVGKLDVTATNNDEMTLTLSDDPDYAYTMATRPSIHNNLIMYQKHSTNFPGEIHCEALTGNTLANWVCETGMHATQSIGSVINSDYTTYVLEGTGNGFPPGADDDTLSCDKAESLGLTCSITQDGQGRNVKQVCINSVCRTKTYEEDGSYTSVTCRANSNNVCNGTYSYWSSVTYDANGNKTSDRSCKTIDATTGACTAYNTSGNYDYTYDANGNRTSQRSCKTVNATTGVCTEYGTSYNYDYTYDADGNKTSQRSCQTVASDGSCSAYASGRTEWVYDENGNMTSERTCSTVNATTGACTAYSNSGYDYTYDANGNQTSKRICQTVATNGNCSVYKSTDYEYKKYDEDGNLIEIAGGSWEYDDDDLVWERDGFKYTYDTNGNRAFQYRCYNYASDGQCLEYQSSNRWEWAYDENGNQTSQRECQTIASSGNCTSYTRYNAYDYTYDANGNKTSERHCNAVNATTGVCTGYGTSYNFDYTYDANGNMASKRSCQTVASNGNCTAYSNGNAYDYTYDANGNMTSQRKCSAVDANGTCSAYSENKIYTYDDNGNQIASQTCGSNTINTTTGECTTYNTTYVNTTVYAN